MLSKSFCWLQVTNKFEKSTLELILIAKFSPYL